ncbi:signal peptidase II [Paracoccus yeei]|uniref:signal peptidase II n=1 Tax=Paracoccus yeei TaxID=147645 RepID=UPI001C8F1226|nr:signal peptidase II [Paracoccus yeei]MBY0136414.1 signal peptidase II [Paracoccus yeei]
MADAATPKPRKSAAAPPRRPAKAPPPRIWRAVLLTAGLVFLLDQVLKYLAVHVLDLDRVREIDVLDPWLNLRMAWNQGMNFGLFSSETDVMRWVLIGIALAVCLWVAIWIGRAKPSRFAQVAAGMLIGGALGNVVDRLLYGAVADFLNMSLPGWRNPYSFNVADIAIFLGAMGLVLQPPEKKPAPKKRKAPGAAARSAAKPAAGAARSQPRPAADPEPKPAPAAPSEPSPPASPGQQGELLLDERPRDDKA